jgi:hypothetical protein
MEPIPILVICPRSIDYFNCQTIPNKEKYEFHFLDAPIELSGFSSTFDVTKYLEECRQYIQQHHIKVVLATRDIPSLFQAQLSQEFEYLQGTSVESSLICLHKYYTHQKIDFASSQYAICLLEEKDHLFKQLETVQIPFPWIMKPCTTACSSSISKVSNLQEAQNTIVNYNNIITDNLDYLSAFLQSYLDLEKYPLANNHSILIEEYINYPYKCCVDGCVSHGKIIIWGISDSHYYSNYPECFADFTFPSTLPESIQSQLNQAYQEIVQQLIKYGFDNQFVDVEFFVSQAGDIKIMEINGRMIPISATLYRQCLNQGGPYTALIQIGMGDMPKTPTLNGLVGGIFYIQTFGKDIANNLFNFDLAKEISNVEIRASPQQEIAANSSSGFALATVNLVGNSYEEIHKQANIIRRQLLKQPESSPWN